MTPRLLLLSIALAACGTSATAQTPGPTLFSAHAPANSAQRASDRVLGPLAAARSTRHLSLVRADAAQIDASTQRLRLNLAPGVAPLLIDQLDSYRNADGTVVWNGMVGGTAAAEARMLRHGDRESVEDPRNTTTLVRNGDNITGSVRVDGRLFRIEPVGQGRHAVIEVDEALLPPDEGGLQIPLSSDAASQTSAEGGASDEHARGASAAAATPTLIRVLVVYTRVAGQATADPTGWAQALVAEANRAYAGSHIDLRLQLAGVRVTDYREYTAAGAGPESAASVVNDLARFRRMGDGHLDAMHAVRNQVGADVMMLVRRDAGNVCGYASEILASAQTAFALMARDCGPGRYTFHHEIGHLQGARHNLAEDDSLEPFPHGHGYVSARGGYATVMATNASEPRVMWFSNPDLVLNGTRMGTPGRHDNARVLQQTRARFARFR